DNHKIIDMMEITRQYTDKRSIVKNEKAIVKYVQRKRGVCRSEMKDKGDKSGEYQISLCS
ncbi:hypothetical protein, partial [Paenibacillus tyrfis]|uniref:hypothetical protein n=1 Tax=Paenibacillus tyrfis TaxID=1501230 RepID=UPI0020A072E0